MTSDLAANFTRVPEADAAELAHRIYGIHGQATRFATEKDDTFRIDAAGGARYVLKVSNPRESLDELDLQVAVLRHVEQVAPALPVPRVIESLEEVHIVPVSLCADESRTARLYSYLDGTPLDAVSVNAKNRYEIGEVLGQLRVATAGFSHPHEHRTLAWDVKHMASLSGLIAYIDNPSHRLMIGQAFARFEKIEPALRACPTQVVHNDFNRSNIVTQTNGPRFVSGIIDFGDTVNTAVAIDVATAVMNQFSLDVDSDRPRDLFDEPRDLLRGYLAHAPLSERELRLIPHLAMARVAVRALLTSWRAKLLPENEAYILRFTRPGWEQLRWLTQQDHDAMSDVFLPLI